MTVARHPHGSRYLTNLVTRCTPPPPIGGKKCDTTSTWRIASASGPAARALDPGEPTGAPLAAHVLAHARTERRLERLDTGQPRARPEVVQARAAGAACGFDRTPVQQVVGRHAPRFAL